MKLIGCRQEQPRYKLPHKVTQVRNENLWSIYSDSLWQIWKVSQEKIIYADIFFVHCHVCVQFGTRSVQFFCVT